LVRTLMSIFIGVVVIVARPRFGRRQAKVIFIGSLFKV
jgi:hypothetical protein